MNVHDGYAIVFTVIPMGDDGIDRKADEGVGLLAAVESGILPMTRDESHARIVEANLNEAWALQNAD